ncbi:hypothetical protein PCANC_24177 [Puccinia coronata f. sp. avenae]|nr:hypothetical protein PCANC_24177 [Puccinia coronata f. sp. avenae]
MYGYTQWFKYWADSSDEKNWEGLADEVPVGKDRWMENMTERVGGRVQEMAMKREDATANSGQESLYGHDVKSQAVHAYNPFTPGAPVFGDQDHNHIVYIPPPYARHQLILPTPDSNGLWAF